MNGWNIVAAIASMCCFIATIAGAIFTYGQLSQRVKSNETRLGSIEERTGDSEIKIARIEEWKAGFSLGANVSGRHHG